MKDLSLFLLKNTFGAKMRKGFKTFCNDDGSTSTLKQRQDDNMMNKSSASPNIYMKVEQVMDDASSSSRRRRRRRRKSPPRMTLEDMILKLEMEEEEASSKNNNKMERGRRSSCHVVNNDNMLLMSARDAALNQYPRFSLDGKDAMYRSSFRNNQTTGTGRRSVCCDYRTSCKFGGERVVWCKPGVVAKLMGLDALPMPITLPNNNKNPRMLLLGTTHLRRQIT